MMKYRYCVMFFFLATLWSCKRDEAQTFSSPLEETGSSAGLFTCDVGLPSRTECHLAENGKVVVPAAGIYADIEVHYTFGCPTANRGSSMVLYQEGGPAQELRLQTESVLSFTTDLPLRIRDDNEAATRSRRFNPAADCSLTMSYRMVPAAVQVSRWTEKSSDLVALINTTVELYDLKKEVQYWYERYVSSPDLIGGILRDRSAVLLASAKLRDQQLGASLKAVADNAPHALIMDPYGAYRARLVGYRSDAATLVSNMERWRQAVVDSLRAAMAEADRSVAG